MLEQINNGFPQPKCSFRGKDINEAVPGRQAELSILGLGEWQKEKKKSQRKALTVLTWASRQSGRSCWKPSAGAGTPVRIGVAKWPATLRHRAADIPRDS